MANDQTTGRWRRFFCRLIGPVRTRRILEKRVRKLTAGLPAFSFPLDTRAVKNVLVILPPEKQEVLQQLRNLAGLVAFFSGAEVTVLAESSTAPLASLVGSVKVEEYALEAKRLFSATFKTLDMDFQGRFDVCCLLAGSDDLVLLNCAGRTAAPVRIGYGNDGSPFVNVRVNPSADRVLRSDWNCAMVEMLGSRKIRSTKWTIAKQTVSEIDLLLKEHHIEPQSNPVCVDALFFRRAFGTPWAETCLSRLLPLIGNNGCIFTEETENQSELSWLGQFNLPLLANLTIPQIAGMVARSGLIITGNSLLFCFAALLGARTIGVFRESELAANCPVSSAIRAVVYRQSSAEETIEQLSVAVKEMTGASLRAV